MNNKALARQNELKPHLISAQRQIESLLVDKDKAKRFLAASLVVASDSNLNNCSTDSIVQSLIGIAMSDLSVDKNVGHAYLVPYGQKCQLQLGYKGYIQLLHRAGWAVKAFPVFHCDEFSMEFDGWDNRVKFSPNIDERDEGDKKWVIDNLRGVYVVARNADTKDEYSAFVGKSVIEKLRKTSPMQRQQPVGTWFDWYAEMACAKAIKKLAKQLPIGDSRLQIALAADDKSEIGQAVDYAATASTGVVIEQEDVITQSKKPSKSVNDLLGDEAEQINVGSELSESGQIELSEWRTALAECETEDSLKGMCERMPEYLIPHLAQYIKERQTALQ